VIWRFTVFSPVSPGKIAAYYIMVNREARHFASMWRQGGLPLKVRDLAASFLRYDLGALALAEEWSIPTVSDVVLWLRDQACQHFPDSEFAQRYGGSCDLIGGAERSLFLGAA
jgi:hypothetical protein